MGNGRTTGSCATNERGQPTGGRLCGPSAPLRAAKEYSAISRRPVWAGTLLFALAAPALTVEAAVPRVEFDVSYTVACAEVPPCESSVAGPDQKVIEAKLQISTRLASGSEPDVEEISITIWSPQRRLRVVDFSPRSQLASDIEGAIDVVKKGEEETSIEGSLEAEFSPLSTVSLNPAAGASKSRSEHLQQTYRRQPPKKVVLTAGMVHREHGVFFKLRPSSQETLEGQREFSCRFLVPKNWRGDYLLVDCRAVARERSVLRPANACGSRSTLVGLHMREDIEAREQALAAAKAYERYVDVVRSGRPQGNVVQGASGELLDYLPGLRMLEQWVERREPEEEENARRRARADFCTALATLVGLTG